MKYIVDLYCYELELVIEIDGRYHNDDEKSRTDITRDKELGAYGLTIFRFSENEVKHDMPNIMRKLEDHYLTYSLTHP